nr:MAK10-like protein [Tanacetum cinerariifolium]
MRDENPIRTLGDCSKPSHEGYRNTIELPVGNNVVPLQSETILLVQNGCSFHGLRSEDPTQHLKDFLKLVDSLDLDGKIPNKPLLNTHPRVPIKPEDFQEKFKQMQDDLLNQMRNFMQNLHYGPPGVDKEHEATTDTELPSTEDIQPLRVQEPPQDSDIYQLIRKECCVEASEEQKQSMEDTMLYALNSKLLLLNSNSQRLDKKEQEVKNVVEQPAERRNRAKKSLQNFRVIHKSSISLNSSQISSVHEVAPILSTKEPVHSLSMGYEHLSITPETESDEVAKTSAKNLLPIPSECEVTSENKRECDVPICENSSTVDDNHSDILFDSNNDDLSSDDESFEDIEYVDASLPDPEIASEEEENVHQKQEEVDLEEISQVQDVVLREKLFSINRLIANIESLNDNPTPVCVFNSSISTPIFEESDNSLLDNFSPEFETFCDHSEETRSGNTTHADNSLPEYDSFCFEIEPDQERLIYLIKNDISDSSNDPLVEEVDLFLFDDSIPQGIENVADDPKGDIRFLEELLIDNSILSHEFLILRITCQFHDLLQNRQILKLMQEKRFQS